jgi:hypothetical protein
LLLTFQAGVGDLLLHRMFKIMDTNRDGFISFKVGPQICFSARLYFGEFSCCLVLTKLLYIKSYIYINAVRYTRVCNYSARIVQFKV